MTQHDPSRSDPYAYDPYASPPPAQPYSYQNSTYQPYAQQGYGYPGQPYSPYGPPTYHRPAWKVVLAVLCFLIAGLALLGTLASLASPDGAMNSDSEGGAAYLFGYFLGFALFIGVPALLGWLLIRKPKQYR